MMRPLSKHFFSVMVVLALGATSICSVKAQDEQTGPTTREIVDQQITRYRDELQLSDYQWAQVERILRSDIRERVAIARRFGLHGNESAAAMEKKQIRALEKELKNSRSFTEDRMKRYLDKPKFKEFKALQEQIHDEFEDQLEAARQAG